MTISTESQSALNNVIQAINSTLEIDDVLRIVMDNIIYLVRAERGFLMLRDKNGELESRIARNSAKETIDPSEFSLSRTIINRVVAEGQPILTMDAQGDPRFSGTESIMIHRMLSILCVPLKVKGKLTGVIYVDNRIQAGIFSDQERELLATFANHAAVALENARLFESVKRTLAEVTELKNMMDNVFSSITSGVITADVDHRLSLCNPAAKSILCLDQPNIIGQDLSGTLSELMGEELAREISNNIETTQEFNQNIIGREFQVSLPSRGIATLTFSFSPLKDATQTTQGIAIVIEDLTETRRLEAQRRLFEKMVSPSVINQLDPDSLQLGGNRDQITVLFVDIRGFTKFSEKLNPVLLVSILNKYLAAAANAILSQEGTIDKFMGDAVMAWFNAPVPQPDHAIRAVRAAINIRSAVQRLLSELPEEFHLQFGVGIHFGEAVLGLVGTEERLEYTAIGDSVNTAKRIQENAKSNQILISQPAYALVVDQIVARPIEKIQAKGKSEPVQVFEILGLKD